MVAIQNHIKEWGLTGVTIHDLDLAKHYNATLKCFCKASVFKSAAFENFRLDVLGYSTMLHCKWKRKSRKQKLKRKSPGYSLSVDNLKQAHTDVMSTVCV